MPTLDFFFFIGSTYSYLSVTRAADAAAARGVDLAWCPFSVRTLMREQNNIPFAGKPVKMRYMWRDVERRARRFGIPFAGAPQYPVDKDELANRVATLAAAEGWCPPFVQAVYRAWFLEDRDPGDPATLATVLTALGQAPDRCIARASEPDIRDAYARQTDRARDLGIFGSPTFVAGREIFWGDDRLDDALDWVAAAPAR